MKVRPAEERDVAQMHTIERDAFADPWSVRAFQELLDHPQTRTEVAVSDSGEVVGYSVTLIVADQAEIANLAVAPSVRRSGLGGQLLDGLLSAVRSQGAEAVFLEVRESNLAARRLYESRGFTVRGRRKQYYRKPAEDALIMGLKWE